VALVKIFDENNVKGEAATKLPEQEPPEVVSIDQEEFNKRVAEHKVIWQKSHPG
jgi:hypothetical protein